MGPTERPRTSNPQRKGRRSPRTNASGSAPRAGRTPKIPVWSAALELERIHARRLRACRSLGLSVPRDAADGPPETLLRRIAMLDRRIEVSLDLAGGARFPAWKEDEEPSDGDEEPGGDFS